VIRTLVAAATLVIALNASASAKGLVALAVPTASEGDRAILETIIIDAVTSVKLCQLAWQRSKNDDLQAYCRQSVSDDTRIAKQGVQLAARLGLSDAALLSPAQPAEVVQSLAQRSGVEFDRSFFLAQIDLDTGCESAMQYAAEFSATAPVKRFEFAVMPIIQRHLDLSEAILTRLSETP
jgi:predicted outer membrane protein